MAARKRTGLIGHAAPTGLSGLTVVEGEIVEQVPNGTKFSTVSECRKEMARLYWQLERGKMSMQEVGARIAMMDKIAKAIIAERALRVAERAGEHAPLVGVQIISPTPKTITLNGEDDAKNG